MPYIYIYIYIEIEKVDVFRKVLNKQFIERLSRAIFMPALKTVNIYAKYLCKYLCNIYLFIFIYL